MAAIKTPIYLSAPKRLSSLLVQLLLRAFGKIRRLQNSRPDHLQSKSLQALTLAAIALPGISLAAEIQDVELQHSYYHENGREQYAGPPGWEYLLKYKPIEAESIDGSFGIRLDDRTKFSFKVGQETWSGATPISTAPQAAIKGCMFMGTGASPCTTTPMIDAQTLEPYGVDYNANTLVKMPKTMHVMATASAETRRHLDATLAHDWDEFGVEAGAGLSEERDFRSRYGNVSGHWDFNQKLTTLSGGLSYTKSNIDAKLRNVYADYVSYNLYENGYQGAQVSYEISEFGYVTQKNLKGSRDEWSANLGLSQIISKDTTVSTGLTYTHTSGYQGNPYKTVTMIIADPASASWYVGTPWEGMLSGGLYNMAEVRPEQRNQFSWNANLAHYFAGPDAALHLDYRFTHDDWGINAHTLEADWSQPLWHGWTVTPRIRYYSQSAANFYKPYFLFKQADIVHYINYPDGSQTVNINYGEIPVKYYSSDQRLSGYGALSTGLTITKQFDRGVSLEIGLEQYRHAGSLKLGGGGEDSYSDYRYNMANVALKFDFDGKGLESTKGIHFGHEGHHNHGDHLGSQVPAGLMYAHMMDQPGDWMAAYHYSNIHQSGDLKHGSQKAGDAEVLADCGAYGCGWTPTDMRMYMHMLDVMYAPTDWLNLMVMFQYMEMDMKMRGLDGGFMNLNMPPLGMVMGMDMRRMQSDGIGDTTLAALFKLHQSANHELHLGLGLSIPTGSVTKTMDNMPGMAELLDYSMQTGSGTWDFNPSLTYNGQSGPLYWGAQLNGTTRLQSRNESNYRLGDVLQTSAWGGYKMTDWLSATVRGVYTAQGQIKGRMPALSGWIDGAYGNGTLPATQHSQWSTMDIPSNYGGHFMDVGFGLSMAIPGRMFQGDRFSLEWLEPVIDHPNGYQLERSGTLNATWSTMF